jgi:hypothetical protein
MLQVYVSNVSAISNVCCKCFYLDVTYVVVPNTMLQNIFCKYFICFGRMLQRMLYVQVFFMSRHGKGSEEGMVVGAEHKAKRSMKLHPYAP